MIARGSHALISKKGDSLAIPKSSIRRIMKLDDEVKSVQQEAVWLIGKATEIFLENLSKQSYEQSIKRGGRMIRYEDVADARTADANLSFLEGKPISIEGMEPRQKPLSPSISRPINPR